VTDSEGECTATWTSDPGRICGAPEVAPGEHRCLAHHPHFADFLADQVEHGHVDLSRTEVRTPIVDALRHALDEDAAFQLDCVHSTFPDELSLPGVRFRGLCRFNDATFTHLAEFTDATFVGGATFTDARFEGRASFGTTTWGSERDVNGDGQTSASFARAHFAEAATFNAARFWSNPDFDTATFAADADFRDLKASRCAVWRLDDVTFGGDVGLRIFLATGLAAAELDRMVSLSYARQKPEEQELFNDLAFRSGEMRELGVAVVLYRPRWSGPTVLHLVEGGAGLAIAGSVIDHPLTVRGHPLRRSESGPDPAPDDNAGAAAPSASWWPAIAGIVDCVITAPLRLTEVSLTTTVFDNTTGLDQLRLTGPVRWPTHRGRHLLADDHDLTHQLQPASLELTYRQLRAGLEASKAAPEAVDFYVGELNARRRSALLRSLDRWLLPLYRWVGGYGVRPGPPLCWLVAVIVATWLLLWQRTDWFVRDTLDNKPTNRTLNGYHLDQGWDSLAFVVRSSISFLSAPADGLTAAGTFLLVFERYTAVTLLTLAVFGIRSRVAR
jgi:Pentapeptide repeats (9 copies)